MVRERMIELAVDGCSCFQIMFVVFAFEWIKKQNDEQRPFVPQVGVGRICKAPSYVVVDFAHYCTHVTKHLVERFELPPPPLLHLDFRRLPVGDLPPPLSSKADLLGRVRVFETLL